MFRVYKRTVQISSAQPLASSHTNTYRVSGETSTHKVPTVLTVPLMIAGAVVGTVLFSMFFALLLVPMGIVGFKAWRLMKKTQQQSDGQTITAEYTVISKSEK